MNIDDVNIVYISFMKHHVWFIQMEVNYMYIAQKRWIEEKNRNFQVDFVFGFK